MKRIKKICLWFFCILFIVLLFIWRYFAGHDLTETDKDEEVSNTCDYFNGEVVEWKEEYLVVKPVAEWKWKDTEKVRIPLQQRREDDRGEEYSMLIPTQLSGGEVTDLKPGDKIRVACNGDTLEWDGDEAVISVVFMLYSLDDEK